MRHIAFLVVVPLLVTGVYGRARQHAPALPFLDWKACPFEGCAYRLWTATKAVTVYNSYQASRRPIAHLSNGDKVTGVTGVVITVRPGIVRMDRDLPAQQLKRGDRILTYAYRGEGTSAAWVNGNYEHDFDISFARWPNGQGCGGDHCAATYVDLGEKHWWAQVKLKSGATGWIDMDQNILSFAGTDIRG